MHKHIYIRNNYVTKYGQDYGGACGILVLMTTVTYIEYNEVSYGPYTGISVGWWWDDEPNIMKSNKIRYNDIHHVMQVLFDGGCIYTLGSQPESEIAYNYTHDMKWSEWVIMYPIAEVPEAKGYVWGVYLDAFTSYVSVHDNYAERLIICTTLHGISILILNSPTAITLATEAPAIQPTPQ